MSLWDTLTGGAASDAANAAAADTYAKQQQAIKQIKKYGDKYAGEFNTLSEQFTPYAEAGNSALARLMGGLGLGTGANSQENFTSAYRGLPGYQAGLDTGTNAVNSTAAARGMLNSGRNEKALYRFGSNYEDQRVGDYLSRLFSLGQQGQSATGSRVSTVGTGLQGQLATRQAAFGGQLQAAPTIGQGMVAGANAEAAGLQNIMNSIGSLAGNAFSTFAGGIPGANRASSFGSGGGMGWNPSGTSRLY